jgi:hypothetical protein
MSQPPNRFRDRSSSCWFRMEAWCVGPTKEQNTNGEIICFLRPIQESHRQNCMRHSNIHTALVTCFKGLPPGAGFFSPHNTIYFSVIPFSQCPCHINYRTLYGPGTTNSWEIAAGLYYYLVFNLTIFDFSLGVLVYVTAGFSMKFLCRKRCTPEYSCAKRKLWEFRATPSALNIRRGGKHLLFSFIPVFRCILYFSILSFIGTKIEGDWRCHCLWQRSTRSTSNCQRGVVLGT